MWPRTRRRQFCPHSQNMQMFNWSADSRIPVAMSRTDVLKLRCLRARDDMAGKGEQGSSSRPVTYVPAKKEGLTVHRCAPCAKPRSLLEILFAKMAIGKNASRFVSHSCSVRSDRIDKFSSVMHCISVTHVMMQCCCGIFVHCDLVQTRLFRPTMLLSMQQS